MLHLFSSILVDITLIAIPGSNKSETQLTISEHTASIGALQSKGKTVDLFPLIFSCPGIRSEAGEHRIIYVNRYVLSVYFRCGASIGLSFGVVGGLGGVT